MPKLFAGCLLLAAAVALPAVASAGDAAPWAYPKPEAAEPLSLETLDAAIDRGVRYLVESQDDDGSWGSSRWTGGVDVDPVPGSFRAFDLATTAMCLEALLDAEPGDSVADAAERAEKYLLENLPKVRRADPGNLPNVWAHGYAVQVFSKLWRRTPEGSPKRAVYEKLIRRQMAMLDRHETVNGGWFYYASSGVQPIAPSCSFCNAAILVCLKRGQEIGIEPPEKMTRRAVKMTKLQQKPDFSYLYSVETPLGMQGAPREINRPAGSLARSQSGNIALREWGDKAVTDEVVKAWLNRMVSRHGWLDMGRKTQYPHESHAAVAGYFFYFGHYYAAKCVEALPESERAFYANHLARLLVDRQEPEGSWFDYPLYSYHKPYGTAFALMSLQIYRKAIAAERGE